MTTPSSAASFAIASTTGWPASGLARAKCTGCSSWQKYRPSNNSCTTTMLAPSAAASRTRRVAEARFCAGSSLQANWTAASVTSLTAPPAILAILEAGQHADGVYADLVDGVTAFHDEQRGKAEPRDAAADLRIVLALQLELADRVPLECIDAQRHDQHVRSVSGDFPTAVFQGGIP